MFALETVEWEQESWGMESAVLDQCGSDETQRGESEATKPMWVVWASQDQGNHLSHFNNQIVFLSPSMLSPISLKSSLIPTRTFGRFLSSYTLCHPCQVKSSGCFCTQKFMLWIMPVFLRGLEHGYKMVGKRVVAVSLHSDFSSWWLTIIV